MVELDWHNYWQIKVMTWKLILAGVIALIIIRLVWYLVVNPLVKRSGLFRGDVKKHEGKVSEGFLLGKEETLRLLDPLGVVSLDEKKGKLKLLVFDLLYSGHYEDARDITDTMPEEFPSRVVELIYNLAKAAKRDIGLGESAENVKNEVIANLNKIN